MLETQRSSAAQSHVAILDAEMVAAHVDPAGIKAAVARGFAALARGLAVQPLQTLVPLPDANGDFIIYSAADYDCGLIGVKVSPYLVKRGQTHGDPVTAYTLLISLENGEPVALCDSLALTAHRTAATTSLAVDHLIGSRTRILAVIGAGPLARLHLRYELLSRKWEEIRVFSPGLAAEPARIRAWSDVEAMGRLKVCASVRDALADADAVMLCTSSGVPVIALDWLSPDVVVTSISTNASLAHEIAPQALSAFQVFCDLRSTAPHQAGEMILAARDHAWRSETIVAVLSELLSGQRKGVREGRRFFRSTGLGIADVAAAAFVQRQMSSALPEES